MLFVGEIDGFVVVFVEEIGGFVVLFVEEVGLAVIGGIVLETTLKSIWSTVDYDFLFPFKASVIIIGVAIKIRMMIPIITKCTLLKFFRR